jgi:hypothetical protein
VFLVLVERQKCLIFAVEKWVNRYSSRSIPSPRDRDASVAIVVSGAESSLISASNFR